MATRLHDGEDGETRPFDIQLTDEAVYAFADITSQETCDRISALIDFTALHPFYGQEYDPYYAAAQPPIPCRVFYCGRYGVYYHVDEKRHQITVMAIEDHRRNPLDRFRVMH